MRKYFRRGMVDLSLKWY